MKDQSLSFLPLMDQNDPLLSEYSVRNSQSDLNYGETTETLTFHLSEVTDEQEESLAFIRSLNENERGQTFFI